MSKIKNKWGGTFKTNIASNVTWSSANGWSEQSTCNVRPLRERRVYLNTVSIPTRIVRKPSRKDRRIKRSSIVPLKHKRRSLRHRCANKCSAKPIKWRRLKNGGYKCIFTWSMNASEVGNWDKALTKYLPRRPRWGCGPDSKVTPIKSLPIWNE